MKLTPEQEQRLLRARTLLLLDHPFFGNLVCRLPNIADPNVKKVRTDGTSLRWEPQWLDSLTDEEIQGTLAVKVTQVANGHTWRRGARDTGAWDQASEMAIAGLVQAIGLSLPEGTLLCDTADLGKAVEQLYVTPKPGDDDGDSDGQGGGGENAPNSQSGGTAGQDSGNDTGCGGVDDAPAGTSQEQQTKWEVAVAQAAASATAIGNMPGELSRMVQDILEPAVPWTVELRDFIEQSARNDYNWTKPNRRYLSLGFILPSLVSEELPDIVVAVDTSGSIGQDVLDKFAAEVSGILAAYATTIHLVYCDANVAHTETVTRADLPLTLKPYGGGGTRFQPVFDWVAAQGLQPAALVYLTDMYGDAPIEPEYPVLWASTSGDDMPAPFGRLVEVN